MKNGIQGIYIFGNSCAPTVLLGATESTGVPKN